MSMDLEQFHDTFFEESFEALDSMEAALLTLDVGAPDSENINTIFRVAHSIKGGAGMFGFTGVTEFTHVVETLLDLLRSNRLQVTVEISDRLLESVDVMRAMLSAVQNKEPMDEERVAELKAALQAASAQNASPAKPPAPTASKPPASEPPASEPPASQPRPAAQAPTAADASATGKWRLVVKPKPELLTRGNDPLRMFAELAELGELAVRAKAGRVPVLEELRPEECMLSWELVLTGNPSRDDIDQVFEWAGDDCDLEISREGGPAEAAASVTSRAVAESGSATQSPGQGSARAGAPVEKSEPAAPVAVPANPKEPAGTAEAEPAVSADSAAAAKEPATAAKPEPTETPAPLNSSDQAAAAAGSEPADAPADSKDPPNPTTSSSSASEKPPKAGPAPKGAVRGESGSIRVNIEKVDELLNSVGEIVITQSMLTQLGHGMEGAEADQMRSALTQLERNVRELQESVMRVRMLPISSVFSRFPRLVRDVSQRLKKKIDLKMTGEQTELDKTVLEKIGDPLVHLIRNSIDHGIEAPEQREALGKPAAGTVHLNAFHKGGAITIEVIDDGKGLDKDRILEKARSRGLVGPNDSLTDEQVYELIFMPGFSTAQETTDLSGRGVGMDVVRRNIQELGGTIELRSSPGRGSQTSITLPLTLAIVDGQSVAVGDEVYIVPLTAIVESLQLEKGAASQLVGQREVFSFRGTYLPIVRMHETFDVNPRTRELHEGLIMVVEGDGRQAGLFVDDLLGQQQVVIKSMETNYERIDGISGATILGDGSVALILDIPGLMRVAGDRPEVGHAA